MPLLSLGADMRRREFIACFGGAAAMPFVARAQQRAMRRVGVLVGRNGSTTPRRSTAFCRGLRRTGFVEGRIVLIDTIAAGRSTFPPARDSWPNWSMPGDHCAQAPLPHARMQRPRTMPIVFDKSGSGRVRLCHEPGAARRQPHWLHSFEGGTRGKAIGDAQARCPRTRPALRSLAIPATA